MIRIFKDPDTRLRCFISGAAVLLLIGLAFTGAAVFLMNRQVSSLLKYAEVGQQRWEALGEANPDINVPQLIDGRTPQLVVTEKPEPSPTSTPTPTPTATAMAAPIAAPKTKTIVRYRNRPTPRPWYDFCKNNTR